LRSAGCGGGCDVEEDRVPDVEEDRVLLRSAGCGVE